MHYRTYSRRILSPFHGMLQVVTTQGGLAESTDGFNWRLYVADERIVSHTGLSEVRYGVWNLRDGCSRSKVRGTSPDRLIEETGEQLIGALEACVREIPFSPADRYEFWLLDLRHGKPLALLETALEGDDRVDSPSPRWYPGAAAKREFRSTQGDADDLSLLLLETAGKKAAGIWVERIPCGDALTADGKTVPGHLFPPLFLRPAWENGGQAQLVEDFLCWQAPWLLQLDSLDNATRDWLEQAAWQCAPETDRVYRLFPDVRDSDGLTATRVRARMIRESNTPEGIAEAFYPFVNE